VHFFFKFYLFINKIFYIFEVLNKTVRMKLDLKKPCGGTCNCPFRTDSLKGWLGQERAEELVSALYEQDLTFSCHKTTTDTEDGFDHSSDNNTQHCAGAMIMMEKSEQANQMMRLMERIGLYDRNKLDMTSPVFDTPEQFIEHHT
jgi:hypothetical protein